MTGPTPLPDAMRRGRRTLLLIATAVLAPVVLSYGVYHFSPPGSFTNYGELLPTRPIPALTGTRPDRSPFRMMEMQGRWTILLVAGGVCDPACAEQLHATRQARTMQGKERERIERVWLVSDGVRPDAALLAEHPDVVVVQTSAVEVALLPRGGQAIHLVDPLGNQVLAWPREPDIKALARDLARLLKASRIG